MDPELVIQQRQIEAEMLVHDLISTGVRIRNRLTPHQKYELREDLLEAIEVILESVREAEPE